MGLTMGTGPFGKAARGHVQLRARPAEGARALPRALAAARARRDRRRDRRRLHRRRTCCTRPATCPSGTSRARTCASTCSRRPTTRRTARSRATRATGRSASGGKRGREQGLGLPRDPAGARRRSPTASRSTGTPSTTGTRRTRRSSSTRATPTTASTCVPSSRTCGSRSTASMLAESSRPMACFETSLPTRWYLPQGGLVAALRADDAQHRAARTRAPRPTGRVGDNEDVAWSYESPIPVAAPLRGPRRVLRRGRRRRHRRRAPGARLLARSRQGREQRIAMSTAQATRTVTLERRTDIDLESYRRVAREGAGIVIGEGAPSA